MSCGDSHTIGLKKDGTCIAVGLDYGRLNVSGWKDIVKIACVNGHTVGLKSDGTCVTVGNNNKGQLNISNWKDIKQVSCGAQFTVWLKKDGTVVIVGDNKKEQYGIQEWKNIVSLLSDFIFRLQLLLYFLRKENKYYTIKNNKLILLENQNLNKSNFEINGVDDLELLNGIDKTDMKLLIYDESNPNKLKLKYTLKEQFRPIDKFEGKIKILKQEMK